MPRVAAKNPKRAKRLVIPKQKPHKKVHYTGFREARKIELMEMAIDGGRTPVVSGGAARSHLCVGETPSKDKIAAARAQGTPIATEAEFLALLRS